MQKQADNPVPQRRHTRRRWPLVVAGVALAGGLALWGAGSFLNLGPREPHPAQREAAPVPVHAAVVARRDVPVFVDGLGTVQPINTVVIKPRVDGQITKVVFQEGEIVHEGDVLVQIDPAPYQAALDQAIAKLAQDQASLTNATQDLARTQPLAKQGDATQQLLDQRTAAVAQYTAQVQADNAAIESAKVQLAYTTIRAPLTGRAGFRLVDAGNIVHASDQTGILTITQLTPIAVVFTAPEERVPAISSALKSGFLPVTALSTDGARPLADGQLILTDNQVDVASGSIRLKARFDNAGNTLWPGQSVATRLRLSTVHDAVAVPAIAVQRGPSGPFAYVITADNKAELRDLKVGAIQDGWAVIQQGLSAGDRVITAGQYRVLPGGAVRVLDENTAAAVNKATGAP